jgi:hypothetical protein
MLCKMNDWRGVFELENLNLSSLLKSGVKIRVQLRFVLLVYTNDIKWGKANGLNRGHSLSAAVLRVVVKVADGRGVRAANQLLA